MTELIMSGATEKEMFMAALLLCTSKYKDAKVRTLRKGEEESSVNVTRENVTNLCPSWTNSELMSRMIRYKVCAPVLDNPMASVNDKVRLIKATLEKQAKLHGIELPK